MGNASFLLADPIALAALSRQNFDAIPQKISNNEET
jgi:hypothetical protein